MLMAPKYSGLDLPIYDADSTLTNVNREGALESGETFSPTTLLRPVTVAIAPGTSFNTPGNLAHLLHRTDEELAIVAELCGAQVVEHQWGLLHDPDDIHQKSNRRRGLYGDAEPLIPQDHYLVAEVDIIKDAINMHPLNAHRIFRHTGLGAARLAMGLNRYERQLQRRERVYHLCDMIPSQFVVGSPAAAADDRASFWLVDIEPRLAY